MRWLVAIAVAIIVVLLVCYNLAKTAAAGNIYCPKCGSEDIIPTKRGDDGHIIYTCNTCKNEW